MTETPNPNIVDTDTLTGEMHPIRRCVLSLGSNLGERLGNLQGAVNALADTPDAWLTAVSPVYETGPVDAPEASGRFLTPWSCSTPPWRPAPCSSEPWPSRTPTAGSAPARATRPAPSMSTWSWSATAGPTTTA